MRNLYVILCFVCGLSFGQNQEIRLGLAGGFNAYQFTTLGGSSYQPENSYFTYNEAAPGKGLIYQSHVLNGFSIGGLGTYAFKKWTFNLEPQYTLMRSTYTFEKEYYTERVVGSHAFRMPIFFTWRFFRKVNSLYFTFGWIGSVTKNYDYQSPGINFLFSDGPLYNGGIDYGDDHFEDVLYNNGGYWERFIGLGKSVNNLNITLRWITRRKKSQEKILANIMRVELNLSYHFISSKDVTKKRSIYYE